MASKDKEQGRCQAVMGEHQCEHPAGRAENRRDGEVTWRADSTAY
jgi:hypothetical protein